MAIDPTQMGTIPQASTVGVGIGMPGVYGPALLGYGGGPLAPLGAVVSFLGQLGQQTRLPMWRPIGTTELTTMVPFQAAPMLAPGYAGGALAPQGFWVGSPAQQLSEWIAHHSFLPRRQLLPFGVAPLTAAYAGGPLAPQGSLGEVLQRLQPEAYRLQKLREWIANEWQPIRSTIGLPF